MIDKETELNKELGKRKKNNDMQDNISSRIDTLLSYGPYKFGLSNINSESSGEERIKEDLRK